MGMLKEFKEFAVKGNLVDIAVGFVMGAAFKQVVTSFKRKQKNNYLHPFCNSFNFIQFCNCWVFWTRFYLFKNISSFYKTGL